MERRVGRALHGCTVLALTTAPLVPLVATRALRGLVVVGAVALFGLFVYVVAARFAIPIELEWMCGSVLDHVERVVAGQPIYAAPTADWVPFMYTPLYYWASAALAHAMPVMVACRLVSIAATVASSALVWRISRRLGATRFWSLAALGCFFGAYSLTGYWYDLERADSLSLAMVLAGTWIAIEWTGVTSAAIAGVVLGFSFYAKQQSFPVAVAVAVGLAAFGKRRRALAFALGAALGIVPLFAWLHVTTGGWFDFYCVTMARAHGLDLSLFTLFFLVDLSNGFGLAAATAVLLAWLARETFLRPGTKARDPDLAVFACALAAAFAASASSRMHQGGHVNVLVLWSAFACVAFAVTATRAERIAKARDAGPLVGGGLALAAACQLAHFAYDPGDATPSRHAGFDANLLGSRVHELEKSGEVFLTGRGHVTTPRHAHVMALIDVMRGGIGIPEAFANAIRERRYAAYVIDEWPELTLEAILGRRSELFDLVLANYYVAERWDDRESDAVVGRRVHPTWVLKPRLHPITGATFEELDRRRLVEAGLAEERMRLAQAGVPAPVSAPTTEEEAAAILRER
jgi:hypothetical protein